MPQPAVVRAGWRWREREWAWFSAAVVACSIVFALWPKLDLVVARALRGDGGFVGNPQPVVRAVYEAVPWMGRAAFLLGVGLWVLWLCGWRVTTPRWRRRLFLVTLSMLLGVGLLVNGALKEGWGRARPVAVQPLGGSAEFTPAMRPAAQCRTNCSFVSGHAATGFALGAAGLLGAPATRRRLLLLGLGAGLLVGLGRMSQGAHFLSDVLFSGLVMWGTHLALRAAWLRWRMRR